MSARLTEESSPSPRWTSAAAHTAGRSMSAPSVGAGQAVRGWRSRLLVGKTPSRRGLTVSTRRSSCWPGSRCGSMPGARTKSFHSRAASSGPAPATACCNPVRWANRRWGSESRVPCPHAALPPRRPPPRPHRCWAARGARSDTAAGTSSSCERQASPSDCRAAMSALIERELAGAPGGAGREAATCRLALRNPAWVASSSGSTCGKRRFKHRSSDFLTTTQHADSPIVRELIGRATFVNRCNSPESCQAYGQTGGSLIT